jgi:hypothetical protein
MPMPEDSLQKLERQLVQGEVSLEEYYAQWEAIMLARENQFQL